MARRKQKEAAQGRRHDADDPPGAEGVEYQSVLIAYEDEAFDEQTIATAKALAAHRRRAIHVIALVSVPVHLSLDARLEAKDEEAQSKIERAKLICGGRVTGRMMRVRPGQGGAAIVEVAREMRAAAIVMQIRYRSGAPIYSKALQVVMARRPCRVIVIGSPVEARADFVDLGPS